MSVPERGLGSGLAAIPIATVAVARCRWSSPVSVSQASFDVAVHEHVDVVVVTSALARAGCPGPAGIVSGDYRVRAAGRRRDAWSTVTVWPAICQRA